jgi:hypothetical protein
LAGIVTIYIAFSSLFSGADYFVGSSFSSIVLNIIDRATVPVRFLMGLHIINFQGFAQAYSGSLFGAEFNGCVNKTKGMWSTLRGA